MKKIIPSIFAIILLTSCEKAIQQFSCISCADNFPINANYSKADTLKKIMSKYTKGGLPGLSIAVYSATEGWWTNAAGYSNIENKVLMQPCHLQYLQSVAKTYMATAIMKLKEERKIVLDTPITAYLPAKYSSYVANASRITVRMLLNHTSGIAEFTNDIQSRLFLLQNPDYIFSLETNLAVVKKRGAIFNPGERYEYINTNYELLALIADAITGDHAKYIEQKIFAPLGLTNTFYKNDKNYLSYPNLVNSYLDRYGNGILENVSKLQQSNVASLIGDDGIQATPVDAVKFLKALIQGQIVSAASLQEMQTWVNDGNGRPIYGMGLFNVIYNLQTVIGHGGGGLGAGCEMYYLPAQNTYVFMALNMGVFVESPLLSQAGNLKEKIVSILQQ